MREQTTLSTLSPRQYAALQDAAKARALRLRQEAIDAAWSTLTTAVRSLVGTLSHQLHRPPTKTAPTPPRTAGAR
jgi:hypothetical protein